MTSVADHFVATLRASGVKRVYGLPGDSLNGFTDALRRDGSIDWIHVRHEEAAAFAAAADAGLSEELAVCVGSCGPGNTHLVNGLYDAQRSRVPVLAIAAQIPGSEIGSEYFQETHPQVVFGECSVYAELISSAENAPRILEIAMRTAIEERGVAVVIVPGEVFLATMSKIAAREVRKSPSACLPQAAALRDAADILNNASRVTILAGAGCRGAHDQVVALADTLGAPVVHALRGKEWVEYDNPFDVGMTGLLGFASGYKAIAECDALLMLGTDFPYRQFYPESAKIIQLDIQGSHIGRRANVDLGLVGTVIDTVPALLELLERKQDRQHLDHAVRHYQRTRSGLDSLASPDRDRTPMHPQSVAARIDELADADTIFTCDTGSPVMWAARYLTMNGQRRLLGSFNHGTMANALSHAIGAQASHPERQVIALAGDGGLTMLFGELITAIQNKLPVKIVVFNNGSLNFVELEMKAAGIVNWATKLENPVFADVANALGMFAVRAERPSELDEAITAALDHDGPALIEVITARQEMSVPPAVSLEQAKGFALYSIRTILSGQGDELLDLVTTNVARRILA